MIVVQMGTEHHIDVGYALLRQKIGQMDGAGMGIGFIPAARAAVDDQAMAVI